MGKIVQSSEATSLTTLEFFYPLRKDSELTPFIVRGLNTNFVNFWSLCSMVDWPMGSKERWPKRGEQSV